MKRIAGITLLAAAVSGCFRLDSNLYNADTAIDAYFRDDFTGETDFILGPDWKIPDSLIHPMTLQSQGPEDAAPVTIHAVYLGDTAQIGQDTVILYSHGNKDHMDFYWQRAKLLAHTGWKNRFGLLMYDYRGFGLSEGVSTEAGMYADAEACLRWLQGHGLTGDRLAMYGFSLGSAPTLELTAHPQRLSPAWVITEAPFASAEVMVQDAAGLAMPGTFFTNLKIDNAEEIRGVQQPYLWFHGVDDDFLAMDTHGEVVFSHYTGTYGHAVRVAGAGHGTVPQTYGFEAYLDEIERFLERPR